MIWSAETSHFEIHKIEGEGLTGRVYKAFRMDSRRHTRQLVAIKLIKSEKDVPVLRREFERLKKMQSEHCVRLLAWENLKVGPALILEYIRGVTLAELMMNGEINESLLDEICSQIQQGLVDLKFHGCVHGDLSPQNIMITHHGTIKLIDFGSLDPDRGLLARPEYLAPEVQNGQSPDFLSDLYALGKIREHIILIGKAPDFQQNYDLLNSLLRDDPSQREMLKCKSQRNQRKKLAQVVVQYGIQNNLRRRTQKIQLNKFEPGKKLRSRAKIYNFCRILVFALIMAVYPRRENSYAQEGALEIRTQNWVKISLNGLPFEYTPIKKIIRPGQYSLRWQGPASAKIHSKGLLVESNQQMLLHLD